MKYLTADLHLHTVLSPCGDLLMTPQNIINQALEVGLNLIAITDHNSAENVKVTLELAQNTPLEVIPGMEVETAEEVHLLCLFDTLEQVLTWQKVVYNSLPDIKNNEELFGPQLLTDQEDDFVGKLDRLLLTATSLTINQVVDKVTKLGGIVIPSHIDKPNYSLISNLGFIPPELDIYALEISPNNNLEELSNNYDMITNYSLVSNSDAHYLQGIRKSMKLYIESVSIAEISAAIREINGRKLILF